jgi:hypothetical protein
MNEEFTTGIHGLLYQIALNTGTPPQVGEGVHALAFRIAKNTAGTLPVAGEGLYDLFYKITKNTAGIPPAVGESLHSLLYKIAGNTKGSTPSVGEGRHSLLFKICGNTEIKPTDPDATNFFLRANISDVAQQDAVIGLALALKAANVWPKMRALYPLVGGTAAAHAQNLKSASFSITWNGGITHSANGIKSDGAWQTYGMTTLNLNVMAPGSVAFGSYRVTATGAYAAGGDIQYYETGNNYELRSLNSSGVNCTMNLGAEGQQVLVNHGGDARAFWVISRTSATLETGYRNGVAVGTDVTPQPTPVPSGFIEVISHWQSDAGLALAFISDGLSGAEVAAMNTAVTAYQTALGRNNP